MGVLFFCAWRCCCYRRSLRRTLLLQQFYAALCTCLFDYEVSDGLLHRSLVPRDDK